MPVQPGGTPPPWFGGVRPPRHGAQQPEGPAGSRSIRPLPVPGPAALPAEAAHRDRDLRRLLSSWLAADAADLLTGPDAERLAACASPPCNRYLLRTHGRRHWCSVRCGDRARAARAYARRSQLKGA